MSTLKTWRLPIGAALGVLLSSGVAAGQDLSRVGSDLATLESQAGRFDETLRVASAARRGPEVEERFADAELLYRLRDYSRAAVLFTDIVDNHANTPAYPQGLFLLADSLYQAGDRFGARTRFRELLRHAGEPLFRPFVQRALGRLIEIAIRLNNYDGVDEYFRQLGQIAPSEVEAQTTYIRGKFLFLRNPPDYEGARAAFESIQARAPIYPQARYFLGVILTAQQRYPEAIEAFQRVLQIQPEGSEQQQVLDLAALAVGRLQIERENFDAAIEAYQGVGRASPFFDRALFEQAWAYIKLGDAVRAERALEILAISSPDSPLLPEGKLLWGNLLLRTGRFDRAQQVFEEVRAQFGPIYQRLNQANAAADPQRYFQELVRSNLQVFDASSFIPQEALAWVRHEGTLDDSLRVVSDLNVCRTYVREASDLIDRLNAALNAPSRSHVFQDLSRARQRVWQVANRSLQLRNEVAEALDASADAGNVELQGVISQRRALVAQVGRMPTDDDGLRRRDRQAENELQTLSQTVQRTQQRVDGLEAMAVAIERYLADPAHQAPGLDRAQLQQELTQQRAAANGYRERIAQLRRMISQARSQIGPGDPRYAHDVELRAQVVDLIRREVDILRNAGRVTPEVDSLLRRLDALDTAVNQFDERVNAQVDQRIGAIRQQVVDEERRVANYRDRLGSLEHEAEDVVGNLILRQFRDVQVQFYQIVMRADLGLVDVAWEQREEHNNRARMLAEEQNREISALNDEFTEVTEGAPVDSQSGARPSAATPAPGATPAPTPTPAPGSPAPGSSPAPTPGVPGGAATAPTAPQGQTP
ncbi:MAG: tetratricopeptide repeat protein [Myxococcales bacterium]|nr:tetratricopeptide repeat protein [Myxococcales bacterium]